MAEAVYVLCVVTSAAIAYLLLRQYGRTGARILLWSGVGFIGLCLNNLILFTDVLIVPDIDLTLARQLSALAGLTVLAFGLIWDSD